MAAFHGALHLGLDDINTAVVNHYPGDNSVFVWLPDIDVRLTNSHDNRPIDLADTLEALAGRVRAAISEQGSAT